MLNRFKQWLTMWNPHIIVYADNYYGVRKLSLFGWHYYSEEGVAHTTNVEINKHCRFKGLEKAEVVMKLLSIGVCRRV